MSELEYIKRMATICCDTCCVTIESDGKTVTHESNCQLNNLKVLMDLAIKNQRELLQRAETAEQELAKLRLELSEEKRLYAVMLEDNGQLHDQHIEDDKTLATLRKRAGNTGDTDAK